MSTKAQVTVRDLDSARREIIAEVHQRETLCFSNSSDVITVRQNWDVSGGTEWETIMLTPDRAVELAKKLLALATAGCPTTIREKPLTH